MAGGVWAMGNVGGVSVGGRRGKGTVEREEAGSEWLDTMAVYAQCVECAQRENGLHIPHLPPSHRVSHLEADSLPRQHL